MKKMRFYSVLACALLTGSAVIAQSPAKIYSAETLPAEAGWTELKLDKTVSSEAAVVSQAVEGGVLKLKATEANKFSQLGWYKTGLGLDLSKGYTIEIKAKVTDASKYGAFNIQGYDNQGRGFRLGIYKDYLAESTDPLAATNVIKKDLNNADGFHIYRLAVAPSGTVTLYRDAQQIGTFPLSAFYFDNIITNGGFEDGGDDLENADFFPDFQSNGFLHRTDEKPAEVKNGKYAFLMDNDFFYEQNGNTDNSERARTWDIPVKPGTKYDIAFAKRRTMYSNHAWRDIGAFYDFQLGTQEGPDERGKNASWSDANNSGWNYHRHTITTPDENADQIAKSLHFEFPSWKNGDNSLIVSAFDDFVFRENLGLQVGLTPKSFVDPIIPVGITNLIKNGDFENHEMNNDGSAYTWALSNLESNSDNTPYEYNPMWNGYVRIQRHDQSNDEIGGEWAHSGTSSVRFTTDWNNKDENFTRNFDFTVELEPNKTYRFVFWHRNPRWNDFGWLLVRIGEGDPIWGHRTGERANKWIPVDLTFTTTADNHTLHLYTYAEVHGDWWNQYFDDFTLYEVTEPADAQIAGKTNLIQNGDFEDVTKNNDGTNYTWALASTNASNDSDFPMEQNDLWGTYVRLQDKEKRGGDYWGDRDDAVYDWAHSGTKSLRISYFDNWEEARENEGLPKVGEEMPSKYHMNINFQKELEPNKTYTFVFWIKTSCWNDRGWFHVANGNIKVLSQELSNKWMNWTRQSVTFSTTTANHTFRLLTEFNGWMSFYLDDLFLYEEATYVPYDGNTSFLFFGKSTGTQSTDVEIEYVSVDNTGAYAPGGSGFDTPSANVVKNMAVQSSNGQLTVKTLTPSAIQIYDLAGACVAQLNVETTANITLPKGVYIVKSASEVVKIVNK